MGKTGKTSVIFEPFKFFDTEVKFPLEINIPITLDKFRGLKSVVDTIYNSFYGTFWVRIMLEENLALVDKEQYEKLIGELLKAFPNMKLQGKNNEPIVVITEKIDEACKAHRKAAQILIKY